MGTGTQGARPPRQRGWLFWRIVVAGVAIVGVISVLIWLLTGQRGCNTKPIPSVTTSQVYSVIIPAESVDNYRALGIITKQNGNEVVDLAAFERLIRGTQLISADFIKSLADALYKAQNGGPEIDSLRDVFNYLVWQGMNSDPELKKLLASAEPAKTVARSAIKHKKKAAVARKPKATSVAKKTLVEPKLPLVSSAIVAQPVPDKIAPKHGEIQIFKRDSNSQVTTTYRVIPPKAIKITGTVGPIKTGHITGTITKSSKKGENERGDE